MRRFLKNKKKQNESINQMIIYKISDIYSKIFAKCFDLENMYSILV